MLCVFCHNYKTKPNTKNATRKHKPNQIKSHTKQQRAGPEPEENRAL